MIMGVVLMTCIPTQSNALAINCGCRAMKKRLKADGHYSSADALKVAKCHGGFTIKVCF